MPRVTFLPSGQVVEVASGDTILDAALDNNIDLEHNCGGNCCCSTCHILIEDGIDSLNRPDEDEIDMLDELDDLSDNSRLSCQCEITEDVVVRIPAE